MHPRLDRCGGARFELISLSYIPGASFRSGIPYAAALASLARIRSALQDMNVR